MDFRRRSSSSSSDSEERDTVRSPIREFHNCPGGVDLYEQRKDRRDRHLERCLSWSIYEDSSLNLATLFYDVGGDELTTPPFYSVARRYCIRHERYSRRRARLSAFDYFEDYSIGNLYEESAPALPTPPVSPLQDDFEEWVANLEAAIEVAVEGAVGGVDKPQDKFAEAIATAAAGGINERAAWRQLVACLQRERVIERDIEASRMWSFAFNEPAGPHFRYIFEADFAVLYDLWERL